MSRFLNESANGGQTLHNHYKGATCSHFVAGINGYKRDRHIGMSRLCSHTRGCFGETRPARRPLAIQGLIKTHAGHARTRGFQESSRRRDGGVCLVASRHQLGAAARLDPIRSSAWQDRASILGSVTGTARRTETHREELQSGRPPFAAMRNSKLLGAVSGDAAKVAAWRLDPMYRLCMAVTVIERRPPRTHNTHTYR